MCKILNDYKKEIEQYCVTNGLNKDKIFSAPRSFNSEMVLLQYHDPKKGLKGLLDETPAPVILRIFKKGSRIEFEQTEYTKKYLAN